MRRFSEPTCKNLLRQPLILGLPMSSLGFLTALTIGLQFVLGLVIPENSRFNSIIAVVIAVLGYVNLRLMNRFLKAGWDQSLLFVFERIALAKKDASGSLIETPSLKSVSPPDTLDEEEKIALKIPFERALGHLGPDQSLIFRCKVLPEGASLFESKAVAPERKIRWKADLKAVVKQLTGMESSFVYSLCDLPVSVNPMWLFGQLESSTNFEVITSVRGVSQSSIKQRIETARWLNASEAAINEVDSEVSFEQASQVLRGLSTGEDRVLELSLVIVSQEPLHSLDNHYFVLEKSPALTLLSALGLRARFHRSFFTRLVTAQDLIFNIADPKEAGVSILKTNRTNPLYFDPQDSRLDALHWLVVGGSGSGSGKSFFVGSVLWRMLKNGSNSSVLFIDSKRSFRRLVIQMKGAWIEPTSFEELNQKVSSVFSTLENSQVMAGIELSELQIEDQHRSASYLLSELTRFLSQRTGTHAIYIVMDECWSLLASDSDGVQRAFREFRKLDAGAIAITQSLSDFTSNEVGKSVIQNASVKILLRQQEDIRDFKYVLGLTETEIASVKNLHKEQGKYSECLIKTPFLSRLGVLETNPTEHEILRTDNIRAEQVAQTRLAKVEAHV